jgi:hypothetical protein
VKQEEEELKNVKIMRSDTGVQADAKPANPMSEMARALKAA